MKANTVIPSTCKKWYTDNLNPENVDLDEKKLES